MIFPVFIWGNTKKVRFISDAPTPEEGSPKLSLRVCGKLVSRQSFHLESSHTHILSTGCHALSTPLPMYFKCSLDYAAYDSLNDRQLY